MPQTHVAEFEKRPAGLGLKTRPITKENPNYGQVGPMWSVTNRFVLKFH